MGGFWNIHGICGLEERRVCEFLFFLLLQLGMRQGVSANGILVVRMRRSACVMFMGLVIVKGICEGASEEKEGRMEM